MTRIAKILLVALALVGLAWAGKGGNGKPGGGGGEGSPTGSLYAGSCELVQGPGGWICSPNGNARLTTSGEKTMIGYEGTPHSLGTSVSHDLHGGERLMLTIRDGSGTNPDGSVNNIVVAVTEDGASSVDLTDDGVDRSIHTVRWGKDDSFVSFIAVVWDGSGTASAHVFRMPVVFNGSGMPVPNDDPAVFLTGSTFVDGDDHDVSSLLIHDWSPDGTELVYTERNAADTQHDLKVSDGSSTSTLVTTDEIPFIGWSPAENSNSLFYVSVPGGDLNRIESDGSNSVTLAEGTSPYWGAAWSPDGAHIAFLRWDYVKLKGGVNVLERDLFVIPAAGGNESKITSKNDRVWILFGWVD